MTAEVRDGVPVYLVRGGDDVILRDAVHDLVHQLVGDRDAGLTIEEVGRDIFVAPEGETSITPLVDAAQTPPFLTDRRVVVGRDLELFTRAEQVAPLVEYLDDPLGSTVVVLVWSSGRVPKSLLDAIKRGGGVQVDASPGRKLGGWVGEQVAAAGLRFDRAATDRVVGWLGDDPQRLVGLLATLVGSLGSGARIGLAELESFLGESGGVPPWDLTDAVDRGDVALALSNLERMIVGGGRHPLQVMATLHAHFARMLHLDGAPVGGEKDAAALLGLRGSTFPARKALAQSRKLGHGKIVRAIELLAAADLDLRGGKAWPERLVVEVLVARLTRLAR